jgi:hypothetical protein
MNTRTRVVLVGGVVTLCAVASASLPAATVPVGTGDASASSTAQNVDLAEQLAAGKLRAVNREVTSLPERRGAIRVAEKAGSGVIWIEGSDVAEGTIDVEIRGRDELQRSFVGIAFHRQDDNTYEAVYLRPFNFRSADPVRRQHAIQYIAVPDYDWPRLRKEFPEEFENPVDASIEPTGWVPLRLVVAARNIQVFVGAVQSPALEVRRLGQHGRGMIGLWTGNNSDGAFANLRITPAK